MPPSPLRPTVLYFCRLGDMIMLTALLNLLHRRYRLPCNVVGTGSWTEAIYKGNPDVAAVWSFGRRLPFLFDGAWREVREGLRESDPGPIYICEQHYRQLPRIRRMLALSGINPARCVYITDEPDVGPAHLVDRLARLAQQTPELLRAADYPCPPIESADGPRLHVLDGERAEREAWLHAQGWSGRRYIVIQPGNHRTMGRRRDRWRRLNTDDKAWPLERWFGLVHRMHVRMPDALIMLTGAPEEVPMLNEIQGATGMESVVVEARGLRPLFALCESAHSVVSVDTGPAHAAAALGVPLVVLYGAESPQYWLPRSPYGSAVVSVGGPPVSMRADQVPEQAVFDAWCSLDQPGDSCHGPMRLR